jgi:hypothetical protein
MAKITVLLLAFSEEKRVVTFEEKVDTVREKLQLVFHYGQNENQPQAHPSVSVGDVAFVDGDFYVCQSVGWAQLTVRELADHMRTERVDRHFHANKIGATQYDL